MGTFVALIGMIILIFPIGMILLKTPYFSVLDEAPSQGKPVKAFVGADPELVAPSRQAANVQAIELPP